jgi:hypothetical protein
MLWRTYFVHEIFRPLAIQVVEVRVVKGPRVVGISDLLVHLRQNDWLDSQSDMEAKKHPL